MVNYLSGSERLHEELSAHGDQWSVVDFYFDFRARDGTANTKLGLLKSLVYQLLDKDEAFGEFVDSQDCAEETWFDREERLVERLIGGLRETKGNVLVFIDGLDECAAHLGQLTTSLLKIQRQTKAKMCLSSRPEPILLRLLGGLPDLQMQDYNAATVRDHIRIACEHFDADETTSLEPLWGEVEREANGVILWARFVIDELFEQRIEGATMKELQQTLRTYPKELKDVYARVLGRLPEKKMLHAAIAFYALRTGQGYFSTRRGFPIYDFFIIWVVMVETIDKGMVFDRSFDIKQFRHRLHAMLGGLVEFSDSLKVVRYVHKTLESYLEESDEVKAVTEHCIKPIFSNDFAAQLFSILIRKATTELVCKEQEIQKAIYGAKTRYSRHRILKYLQEIVPEGHWCHRLTFLLRAIDEYPKLLSDSEADIAEICFISTSNLFMVHGRVGDEDHETCHCGTKLVFEARKLPRQLCFLVCHNFTLAFRYSFARIENELSPETIESIIIFVALVIHADTCTSSYEHRLPNAKQRGLVDFLLTKRKPYGYHIIIWLMTDFDKQPDYMRHYHDGSVKVELGPLPRDLLYPWPSANLLFYWVWLSDDCWGRNACLERLTLLVKLGFDVNAEAYDGGTVMNALFDDEAGEGCEWLKWHNISSHKLWPFSRMKFDLLIDTGYYFKGRGQHSNILECATRFRQRLVRRWPGCNNNEQPRHRDLLRELDEVIEEVLRPLYTETARSTHQKPATKNSQMPDSPARSRKKIHVRKLLCWRAG